MIKGIYNKREEWQGMNYNPKSRLAGTLFCGGVNDAREIEGNPKLQKAFDLGKSIG